MADPRPDNVHDAGRRRFRAIAVLLGLLVGLLAAEGLVRLYRLRHPWPGKTSMFHEWVNVDMFSENPRDTYVDVRRPPPGFGGALRQYFPEHTPKGHFYAVEYHLNSLHFRDREFPPASDRPRIAFLGDSFTYGEGVRDDDVYPRVIERLIRRSGDEATEVLNLAYTGLDIPQIRAALENVALPLDVDEVYYTFVLNDPIQSPRFKDSCPGDLMNYRETVRRSPSALYTFVADKIRRRRVGGLTVDWYRRMYTADNSGIDRTYEILRGMNDLCRRRGVTFRMIIFPLLFRLEGDYPFRGIHQTMCDFCAAEGIPCLDLLAAFDGRDSASLWITSYNSHPNETAHQIAGDAIFEWRRAGHPAGGE